MRKPMFWGKNNIKFLRSLSYKPKKGQKILKNVFVRLNKILPKEKQVNKMKIQYKFFNTNILEIIIYNKLTKKNIKWKTNSTALAEKTNEISKNINKMKV